MAANANLRFVAAVQEASRRLDMPVDDAEEALREAIRTGKVIVGPPTADGEATYDCKEDVSTGTKCEPGVMVDYDTFDMWIFNGPRDVYKKFVTEMIGGHEARSLVENAAGYDKDAAEQWLRRKMRTERFVALHGNHDLWLEGARTDTQNVDFTDISAGIDLRDLSVAKEDLQRVLAAEFPQAEDRPAPTSLPVLPARHQGNDPESLCREWLAIEMLKSLDRTLDPKQVWQTKAREQFPGLSKGAFNRAWSAAIRETGAKWGKPGRKSLR